jgi:hypothetical protein
MAAQFLGTWVLIADLSMQIVLPGGTDLRVFGADSISA